MQDLRTVYLYDEFEVYCYQDVEEISWWEKNGPIYKQI